MLGALAVLAAPIAIAQTQGPNDGTEESETTSASVSASAPPPRAVVSPRAIVQQDGMVFVAGGRFTMGTNDAKAAPNEKPAHEANVGAFWIDRTEVTVCPFCRASAAVLSMNIPVIVADAGIARR